MNIYVDVLVLLNFIIDYFIIRLTAKITNTYIKNSRLIISSAFASLFSLKILLPKLNIFFELIVILFSSFIITIISFTKKKLIKNLTAFFIINIIYNGLMTSLWIVLKPKGMIISNGAVYFNISPITLIISTVIFYLLINLVAIILKRISPYAKRCIVKIDNKDKIIEFNALVDTGNSISDPYSNRHVIITDISTANLIFDDIDAIPKVLLPFKTINGSGLMPAYQNKNVRINNSKIFTALIAVSEENFNDDYKAIVNPKIFDEVSP